VVVLSVCSSITFIEAGCSTRSSIPEIILDDVGPGVFVIYPTITADIDNRVLVQPEVVAIDAAIDTGKNSIREIGLPCDGWRRLEDDVIVIGPIGMSSGAPGECPDRGTSYVAIHVIVLGAVTVVSGIERILAVARSGRGAIRFGSPEIAKADLSLVAAMLEKDAARVVRIDMGERGDTAPRTAVEFR